MKDDTISRQAAIGAINTYFGFNVEEEYGSAVQEVINSLPSAQPGWTTNVKDILEYLDIVVHPLLSPEYYNVYSLLHDMVSGLLKL